MSRDTESKQTKKKKKGKKKDPNLCLAFDIHTIFSQCILHVVVVDYERKGDCIMFICARAITVILQPIITVCT